MTDRERLIRRLNDWGTVESEPLADYLLSNGAIVPPCKVGDIVWVVFSPKYPANPNDKGKWFMTQDGVQRIIWGSKGLSIETWNMGTIPAKKLGKEIFLTKEEAEQALAERSEGNENL
jgi:hypothetical protein